jgi:hypothetical protein
MAASVPVPSTFENSREFDTQLGLSQDHDRLPAKERSVTKRANSTFARFWCWERHRYCDFRDQPHLRSVNWAMGLKPQTPPHVAAVALATLGSVETLAF